MNKFSDESRFWIWGYETYWRHKMARLLDNGNLFEEDIKLNWKTIKVEYCFDVLDKDFITIYEKNKVLYEKIFDQNDIHFTFTEFEEYYQARYRIDKNNSEDIPSEGEIKNLILNIIEKIKQVDKILGD